MCHIFVLPALYGGRMPLPSIPSPVRDAGVLSPKGLVSSGLVARVDSLASVTMARYDGGKADSCRFIDVDMYQGMKFRLLPDRGMDIGAASAHGVPFGWQSQIGEIAPLPAANGMGWIERFTGGLLTTCGPDNIGVPSVDGEESLGLHGSWSFLSAADVQVHRREVGEDYEVVISARLEQVHALGRRIGIERTISTRTGCAVIDVHDVITNHGYRLEPIPMLYHLNFGAPFWNPNARIQVPPNIPLLPRTPYAATKLNVAADAPAPGPDAPEYVFERVVPNPDTVGVRIISSQTRLSATVQWTPESLPTSHQWVHPAMGVYALGIEPANAGLAGRAVLRVEGTLPMLEPGVSRSFGVRVSLTQLPT
jgi:Domain of unknown function (DUF4432)